MNLAHYVEALTLLGDENRLRLCVLLRGRELSVGDLVRVTGLPQPRVSTHLGRLREGGIVRDRRVGSSAFYTLALDVLPPAARALVEEAARTRDATLAADRRRLAALDAERRGTLPSSFIGEMERHYSPGRTWESLAHGLTGLLQLGDVLDVGSADGAVATLLAPYCRSLTCVDVSLPMIDAARKRLARFPHARALSADAHVLPFEPSSFDDVLVFHTLTYAEDPARVVGECARVLRPGGRLVLLSLDAHTHRDLTAPYGERHAGFAPDALRTLLDGAGLLVTSCEVVSREAKKPHFQVVFALARAPVPSSRGTPS
jgi:ArsR family transcriptional regulator